MPNINTSRKTFGLHWIVYAYRRAHVAIVLAKPHNTAIASTAQEDKVCAVWPNIVSTQYLFVRCLPAHIRNERMPLSVVTLQQFLV